MATVNAINRSRGQKTRGGVCAVLKYTMQPEKTAYEGRQLVTGLNCQPECCYTEFISTKLQYGKCDGKMYFHFVQSFHPDEPVTPEAAHQIALELAQSQWPDYEVIVATHTDRDHIHSHLIVNSVSFETGRKLHFGKDDLSQLRNFSDELCLKRGLSICEPGEQQTAGISQAEYHAALRGESWKIQLAIQIDEAMKYAIDREQFIELMESEGYTVKWTDSRKSITYTTPDGHSCRDYRLHDTKYLKEVMEYEFEIRAHRLFSHHGGTESQTADGAPGEYEQGNESPEVGHADGIQLDRADQRGGADRAGGHQATGDGGATDHRPADGREAQRPSLQLAGTAQRSNPRDAERCARTDSRQCKEPGADAQGHDGHRELDQVADGVRTKGLQVTGWERQRLLLFANLAGDRFAERVREYDAPADVSSHHHSGAVGVGAASVLTGLTVLDDQDEDPEERRREMEARESAQNFGALAGLAAGAAIAVQQKLAGDEPVQEEEPDWTGPTMKMTM